jgi:PAS domain S-box-containing protein
MNLKIKGLILGLGALLTVLLASGLLAYQNTRRLRDDAALVAHSHQVIEALQSVLETMTDAETGQRGFLITGDPHYLEPYQSAVARARQTIAQARLLVRDDPSQRLRGLALEELAGAKLAELEQTLALQAQDPASARRMVQTHLGRSIMDSIRAQVGALVQAEQALLATREHTSRRSYRIAVGFTALSCLLGMALALALGLQMRRHLRDEQRFRTLMELAPDGIWVHRGDRLELVNSEALRLLGAASANQVEGMSPYQIFHPDCHAKVRDRIEAARAGQTVHGSEEMIACLDGSVRQVEVSSAPFVDAQGPAIQVVLRDITRRRRRDQALDRLNRALRALSKSNQALMRSQVQDEGAYLAEICAIVTQDCGYAMVWIGFKEDDPARSIRPAAWAGFEDGYLEALQLTWADSRFGQGATGVAIRTGRPGMCKDTLTDPAFAPWRAEAVKRGYRSSLALPLLSSGKPFGAITFYAREPAAFDAGETALLEELTSDLAYGITAHRLRIEHAMAAETLRESEQRFRAAFELGASPMALTGLDGRLLKVNSRLARMLGYTEAEMQGLAVSDITHPDDLPGTRAGFDKVLREGAVGFRQEKRYLHKDGTILWVDMGTVAVPDAMGRALYLVTHIQDITERKRAEQELRAANQRKDEFLATLAHELRNPLAPIRTGAYLLSKRPTSDPETGRIVDMIARQAAHMARLVDDLLDVARIEQGRLELRKERVDPGLVAAHAAEACRALIEAGNHPFSLSVPAPLPVLEADPVRLEQMLCNLLNNACKCTPPGGRIELTAAVEGGELVLAVRDDGIGMSPGVLAHIFDLFFQAGQATDRPGGLGIGLTLVQRLAQLHGGSVSASSAGPGLGSEFKLRLPLLEPAPPAPEPEAPVPEARQRHVLIVDDDPNVRMTMEMLLKTLDYQVTAAATGAKGIERAVALRPDIALIDLGMPGLNGLEVATRIRAALGQAIRLVALTGYSRDSDFAQTKAAGFDQHLVKSGDPRELLRQLEALNPAADR